MRYIIPILALAMFALIIYGCVVDARRPSPPPTPRAEAQFERCERLGGIPITSIWDGRLTDCILPPEK